MKNFLIKREQIKTLNELIELSEELKQRLLELRRMQMENHQAAKRHMHNLKEGSFRIRECISA